MTGHGWRALSRSISFEQLNVFRLAALTGSFTDTAERLYLTQSAVSQRMKHLESAVGAPLFARGGHRGLRLTPAGERFLEFATAALQQFSDILTEIYDSTNLAGTGRLSIATGVGFTQYVMPGLLEPFHQAYPHILVTLMRADPPTVGRLVLSGGADLGVQGEPVHDHDLAKILLLEDGLVLVVPPNLRLSVDALISARSSGEEPLPIILPSKSSASGTRPIIEQWAAGLRVSLNIVMEIDDVDATKQAAAMGIGCAIVPYFALHDTIIPRDWMVLQDIGLPTARKWYVVYRKEHKLSSSAQAFVDFAQRWAGRPSPADSFPVDLSG